MVGFQDPHHSSSGTRRDPLEILIIRVIARGPATGRVSSLTCGMSRPELSTLMRATYPDASAGTIANHAGEVWNFINIIALGDLVVPRLQPRHADQSVHTIPFRDRIH